MELVKPNSVDYKEVEALYTIHVELSGLKNINNPFAKRTQLDWDSIRGMQDLFAKQIVDKLVSKGSDLIFWPESFPEVHHIYSEKLKALQEAQPEQKKAAHADLKAFILNHWVKKVPV